MSKVERQRSRLGHASRVLGTCLLLPLLACVGFDPANVALEQFDSEYGYRPRTAGGRDPGSVVVYLAFSGGGTRAAAFAYGVLEELRDTHIVVDGVEKSFLDEVDTLSGVSGGAQAPGPTECSTVSILLILPILPLRTSSQALRNVASDRCWLPVWKTVP